MKMPVKLEFKKLAMSPQISVIDADGNLVFYVKQKLFKLKEAITVFADREQTQPLYTINADRIIDFSARYHFKDMAGNELGSIKRRGRRSLWKAHYDIYGQGDQIDMSIQEESAMVRVMDSLLGEIPIVGIFSGYFFNPTYLVSRGDQVLLKVNKKAAFLESSFEIEEVVDVSEAVELQVILAILMMTLLERTRG